MTDRDQACGQPGESDKDANPRPGKDRAGAGFMRDWVTIWQSELAAMAQDRELHEGWARFAQFWGAQLDPARFPAAPAQGAAPAAAASELEQLRRRVAELEARLAALESRTAG